MNEKIKEKVIAINNKLLNSIDRCIASLRPKILAPVKAGIDNKKAILLESTLLNFKNRAAVKVIPALLTPGTSAKI